MVPEDKHGCYRKASVRFPSDLDPAAHGCHTPWRTLTGMKVKRMLEFLRPQEELIATFGHPQLLPDLLDSRVRIIRAISLALLADKVQKAGCYRRSGLLMGAAIQSRAGLALTGVDLDVLPPPDSRYL